MIVLMEGGMAPRNMACNAMAQKHGIADGGLCCWLTAASPAARATSSVSRQRQQGDLAWC